MPKSKPLKPTPVETFKFRKRVTGKYASVNEEQDRVRELKRKQTAYRQITKSNQMYREAEKFNEGQKLNITFTPNN
jgi:hypothetical protein